MVNTKEKRKYTPKFMAKLYDDEDIRIEMDRFQYILTYKDKDYTQYFAELRNLVKELAQTKFKRVYYFGQDLETAKSEIYRYIDRRFDSISESIKNIEVLVREERENRNA